MRPSLALELHRDAVRAIVLRHKAANPRVFGSAARGDDLEGSDLDILVDVLPGATLFDLGGIQVELEARLGVSVEVATAGALHPRVEARVLAEARAV